MNNFQIFNMKFKQKLFYFLRFILSYVFTKLIFKISLLVTKISNKKYIFEKNYQSDNRKILVFKNYRYQIKAGWSFFHSLESLSFLKNKKLLSDSEVDFFNTSIGQRTLMKSLEEINLFSQNVCKRYEKFFFKETLNSNPRLRNDLKRNNEIMDFFKKLNLKRINFLNSKIKRKININSNILEIGYISGGHSIMAFQELGFKSFGIDNFYDGNFSNHCLPYKDVKNQLNSNSTFIVGDISKRNLGYENKFDLIYSTSVLEHLIDIDKSLLEMNNLLKDDGIIFHNYNPYFCVDGGHSLGIGDSPFMHLQLSHKEYISYLKENRPFESEIAINWIDQNMNQKVSQKIMKEKIVKAGFEILYFDSFNYRAHNIDLTPKIYNNIKKNYEFLNKDDLLGVSVTFIAKKI